MPQTIPARIPKIGDHVLITDWDTLNIPASEAIKLSKLPYLTVNYVMPLPVGEDGNYKIKYLVDVEETDYIIGFNWSFYN